MDFDAKIRHMTELIGAYGVQCSETKILAPTKELTDAINEVAETHRMQMAGISEAAMGYWKEGDSIHPDYDCIALRDVAALYGKYDTLFKQAA